MYVGDDGYPKYRRPDDRRVVIMRGHEIGNECVVLLPSSQVQRAYQRRDLHVYKERHVYLQLHIQGTRLGDIAGLWPRRN